MKITAKGLTDKGLVRSSNQDSLLLDDRQKLFIVADGMGGHAGGEIASSIAVETISRYVKDNEKVFEKGEHEAGADARISATLADAINHASAKIYEHALEDPALRGMGTTTTLVKFVGRRAYCAHVGDSRLYLIRSRFLYQITFDHSLVNEQVRAGILTPEEAEIHHLKNVITRSVGYQEEEDVDTTSLEIEDGDQLVLCSDGLHGKVNDQEISNIRIEEGPGAVDQLINLANERGGEDNITVIVMNLLAGS